jgi:hypothetical protein
MRKTMNFSWLKIKILIADKRSVEKAIFGEKSVLLRERYTNKIYF